jgi:hypothetical protein
LRSDRQRETHREAAGGIDGEQTAESEMSEHRVCPRYCVGRSVRGDNPPSARRRGWSITSEVIGSPAGSG